MRTQVFITILALATLSNAFMLNQTPRPGGPGKMLRAKQASNNAPAGGSTTDTTSTTDDSTATTLSQGVTKGSAGASTGSTAGLSAQANQLVSQLTPAQQTQLQHLAFVAQKAKSSTVDAGDLAAITAEVHQLISQLTPAQQTQIHALLDAQKGTTDSSDALVVFCHYIEEEIENLLNQFFQDL